MWKKKGIEFYHVINSWLDVIYRDGKQPSTPEPVDERSDMERVVVEALEHFNKTGQYDKLREMFPPSYYAFCYDFYKKFSKGVEGLLAIRSDLILTKTLDSVFVIRENDFKEEPDVLMFGASRDKKYIAKALRDRIEILNDWDGKVLTTLKYPDKYNQGVYEYLYTPYLDDPGKMDIKDIKIFSDVKKVLLSGSEGIYLISEEKCELLYPEEEKLNEIYEKFSESIDGNVKDNPFSINMRYPNVDISPDEKFISLGGMFPPPVLSNLIIRRNDGDNWKIHNTSGAQSMFPKVTCFHNNLPCISFSACLYASLNNSMVNTTFKIDLEQLEQEGEIEEFAGGIFQNYGIVCSTVPHKNGFILGMDNGYLWHMSAEENIAQIGYAHVGGSINFIDFTPDNKYVIVGKVALLGDLQSVDLVAVSL